MTQPEVIATRIIDLARAGERNPRRLRERVLKEAGMADHMSLDDSAGSRSKQLALRTNGKLIQGEPYLDPRAF